MSDPDGWVIVLGIDAHGGRWPVVEMGIIPDRSVAIATARLARGKSLTEVQTWASAMAYMDVPDGYEDAPITGASLDYYDGEQTTDSLNLY